MRTCTTCKESKCLDQFAIRKDRPIGRASRCKKCSVSYALATRNTEESSKNRKEHRKNRPDLMCAASKRYRDNHPEYAKRQADRIRQWVLKNPELAHTARARYSKEHPEKFRFYQQSRRARLRNDGGVLSSGLVILLLEEQGNKCPYCCKDVASTGFHIDHVIPVSLGGHHEDSNMQILCPTCNRMKSNKHPNVFHRVRMTS